MLQSAANSSEVVVKAGSCTGRSVYLCIPNKVYQIDATALQLGLGVRAGAREGADMEGRRVGYRSEWSGRGRGQGERERERRSSCQGFGRGGACASAATLLGSGGGKFRQGSHDIQDRKLHLR